MLLAGVLFQPRASVEAWDVKESDFSAINSTDGRLKFLLNYAILAPSSHNSQPWKFNVTGNEIKVFADKTRWLQISDADQRELYISTGCALENLLIAADHFGNNADVRYFPNASRDDLVASVELTPGSLPADSDSRLFQAILARHTNRNLYEDRAIARKDIQALMNISTEGTDLYLSSDPDIRSKFMRLVTAADQVQYANQDYKSELGYWLGQGVMGPTGIQAKIAQMYVLFLDTGAGQTKKDATAVNSTPVLGFISTRENDRASQVKAGQLLERLWLKATAMGIQVHPMSQALKVPETKSELRELLPQKGLYPQQTFRLGYASPEGEHTPRRPLNEVIK